MIYPLLHSVKNTSSDLSDVDLIKLIGHWQGDSLVAYIAEQIGHVGE
jgi:hypothetical protein